MTDHSSTPLRSPRIDSLRASLMSGFIATFALTVSLAIGYGVANALGDASGNSLQRWFAALSGNDLTEQVGDRFAVGMILNAIVGLVWAVIYASWFEPRLSGPGWRRGAIFALIPWLVSIIAFFAIVGIGAFGISIDAGPLPVIGNLVLHLVYGVVLGSLYCLEREGDLQDRQANANSEKSAAFGMIIGAVAGGIGGRLVAPGLDNLASTEICIFAGALSGAAIGTLIGSLLGLKIDPEPSPKVAPQRVSPAARPK